MPTEYDGLASGTHVFHVRARFRRRSSRQNRFSWTIELPAAGVTPTPQPSPPSTTPTPTPAPPSTAGRFSISGDLPSLLTPGTGGVLPLEVSNPNDFDVLVSDLVVSIRPGSSRRGCDGPSNLQVTQSNAVAGAVSILVPAHGSVTLPAQGATAPWVEMLNLATNQDVCQGAAFGLAYSGTAWRAP
jgi:hypothetical protein